MIFFACVVCKATHCLLRLFNFGATSLPGALALKICPDILGYAAKNVDIIAVTGTNGKTTSARIIERALQNSGRSVCANRSGANLMPGITAELIMNKSLFGSTRCESAVIECDEAACRLVLGKLRPRVLLITNLFRDQLDRYGTVAHPRDCIAEGLRDTPETIAVINADCPMAASVSRLCPNRTVYYGLGEHKKTSVGSGEDEFVLTGTADRVDGWEHGGKLYIRIVDYKSGKKKFALSDVWQGMGLQMLLYLFTLEKHGAERYGKEIVPAGVLYVPAHDILVRADKRLSDEEIVAEKARKLHRSGLILSETEVVEAMEHGEALQFLPLYRGKLAAEALATAEQLGKLSRFLEETLSNMAGELRGGSIAADPWYENDRANTCRTCDYCDACRFSETADGWRFKTKFKAPEFWEKLENGEEETACP